MDTPEQESFQRLSADLLFIAVLMILPLITSGVVSMLLFHCGWSTIGGSLIGSYIAVYGLYLAATRDIRLPLIGLALTGLALFLASLYYDYSFDARSIYKEQIFQLARGWNPMKSDIPVGEDWVWTYWANYYPQGMQVIQAGFFKLTGQMELAKGVNLMLAMAALASSWSALLAMRLPRLISFIMALALVLNPIVIGQLWTLYGDGNLYLMFLTALCLFQHTISGGYFDEKGKPAGLKGWLILTAIASIILIFPVIKITGFVFSLILYLLLIYRFRSRVGFLVTLSLAGMILFYFIGYRTFFSYSLEDQIRNINIAGAFMDSKVPRGLRDLPSPLISVVNYFIPTIAFYQTAFVDARPISYDVSHGLYGYIFGCIWLLTVIIFVCRLFRRKLRDGNAFLLFIFMFAVIVPMVNPDLSNQRYYSIQYVFPFAVLVRLFLEASPRRRKVITVLALMLLINPLSCLKVTLATKAEKTTLLNINLARVINKSADCRYLQVAVNSESASPIYLPNFLSDRLVFKDLKSPFYVANHTTNRPSIIDRFNRGRDIDVVNTVVEKQNRKYQRFDFEPSGDMARIAKISIKPLASQKAAISAFPWPNVRAFLQYNQWDTDDYISREFDVYSSHVVMQEEDVAYIEVPYYAVGVMLLFPRGMEVTDIQWRQVDPPPTLSPSQLVP